MELYLSRILLNPRSKLVMKDLGNPQELHRTISSAFPKIENPAGSKEHEKKKPRGEFDLLHRLEVDRREGRVVLLVQSSYKPDWGLLFDGNYCLEEPEVKHLHDIYSQLAAGQRLRFRICANPTKRVPRTDTKADPRFRESPRGTNYKEIHGKHEARRRVEIVGDEKHTREQKLIEWLERKGTVETNDRGERIGAGYRITNVSVDDNVRNVSASQNRKLTGKKEANGKRHTLSFGAVTFDGVLEVTDANQFRHALVKGIGTGKAYGFGLLSIAPVKEVK